MLEKARQEVVASIIDFGMGFKRLALFIIRRKYPNLDLTDVDLTLMEVTMFPTLLTNQGKKRSQVLRRVFRKRLKVMM